MDIFDNKCIRTILGLTWYNETSNEEQREKSRQEPMSSIAASQIIRWTGHVWRMHKNRITNKIKTGNQKESNQNANKRQCGEMQLCVKLEWEEARGRDIKGLAQDIKLRRMKLWIVL